MKKKLNKLAKKKQTCNFYLKFNHEIIQVGSRILPGGKFNDSERFLSRI